MSSVNLRKSPAKVSRLLATALLMLLLPQSFADTANGNPYQVVQLVTQALQTTARRYEDTADADLAPFYKTVEQILAPAVDFDQIARLIMGKHYAAATPAQREKFANSFRASLIATYSKSLLGLGEMEIVTLNTDTPVGNQRRVTIQQKVNTSKGIIPIAYTLARNKKGEWKVLNMQLLGINLGQVLRNQFSQAVKTSNGGIDQAIDDWLS